MLVNFTRFLRRTLCFPCLVGSVTWQRERLDSEEYSTEGVLIAHIRAKDVAIRLRRIPVGFYVVVETEYVTEQTSNKSMSVGKDVVEWDDAIVLSFDRSSRISLTVIASFEFGPTLGGGECVGMLETTVGELLDRNGQPIFIRFFERSDGEVVPSSPSLEIEVEQRVYGRGEYEHAATSNPPESDEMRRLGELTDSGHHALIRYRELKEQRDLDESVRHFECVRDLCPPDHPSEATVLFNLATAKLIHCRVNDMSPDLDVPINLYRSVLRLRPRSHPDHLFTLLSLGIALEARFQRQADDADEAEGKALLSQVLDVAPADSYVYQAAVLALGSAAKSELVQPMVIARIIEDDLGDNRKVQRLDAALQQMLYPDSCGHAFLDHLGILFCIRFDCLNDFADPQNAISVLENVIRFTSDNHPDKASWLNSLGNSLSTRYHHLGEVADLEKSISRREDAVQLTLDSHPDKPSWLNNLGISLFARYHRLGNVIDLEKSISMEEDALRLTPDDHPDKPSRLTNLGNSLLTRYQRLDDIVDLERSISVKEDAVRLAPDGHPEKPLCLNNLGNSLSTRYHRFGDIVDLKESISMFENAMRLTPDDHPDKSSRLNNLGNLLSTRYQRFGDIIDLKKSISMKEDAVQSTPDGHPDKPSYLNNLGSSFLTRYQCLGDIVDLEKSISLKEDALRLIPDGHPEKPSCLNNLGNSLSTRYHRSGDIVDLEKSISVREDAVRLTPDGHPDKPPRVNNLGISLSIRYQRFGDVMDLGKSISMFEDVVRLTPDGHPDKPARLNNLGISLFTRYQRFGDTIDLEKSVSMREDAVQLTPDGHPDKPTRLNNLGISLWARYHRFGDIVDLEKSISKKEDAVRLTPDGHPDKPARLNDCGISLFARYQRFGDIIDLGKSISMLEGAVQLTPDGHRDKPSCLNNLGTSLRTRYRRFGDIVDLEKSTSMFEDAVRLTPDNHPDKPPRLNNLGTLLSTRYQRFGDTVDLEKSISMREHAVRLTPDGHPHKPSCLTNLGMSLSTRYERFGDIVDLERSISMKVDAVKLTPDGHPDKPARLNALGLSLSTRYERRGDVIDLEKSIPMFEDAVRLTPDGHPEKPLRMNCLALSFLQRFQRSSDLSSPDLSRAILYSSQAARSDTGSSLLRLRASKLWVHCARLLQYDSQSLLDPYMITIDLLPQLPWIGSSLHDRYHRLLGAADDVCNAAAAALDAHRPELAVEWLEQCRSIMWSQLSQLRTPVDDIRTVYPELAAQFERVSNELENSSTRDSAAVNGFTNYSNVTGGLLENQARQHHALALSRERLLTEIRALPGFERFLLPKTVNQLSSLAHSGPVVFLNASKYRCDALVVMPGSEHVTHVPLLNTTYDEVAGMQLRLYKLLRLKGLRDDSARGARLQDMSPDDVFSSILPYLWDKIVSPILDVLAFSKSGPKLPRIFWCPTGPFTFLPIHAAGIYGTANPGPKLSDFAISSYIPTMNALEQPHQEDPEAISRNVRLLAVPQPSTDGQVQLTYVPREMEVIRELAYLSPFASFQEADGTVEDVSAKMTETDWVHFACHGTQDQTNPLDSGLLLAHGSRLKLSDIVRLSRPPGGLAFLSACQTATGDEKLSEEAIHIAAGMLLAGYRSVIATMWSIVDSDAPRVAKDVYERLFQDGKVPDSGQAAEALHHAIERLRDSGASFLCWVPFIHVGL